MDKDGFISRCWNLYMKNKDCLNLFHKVCNQNLHNFLSLNGKCFVIQGAHGYILNIHKLNGDRKNLQQQDR